MFNQPNEQTDNPTNSDFEPHQLESHNQSQIEQRIASQEIRKLKAKSEKHHSIWFGLGMFGLIGWSVAVPAVIGAVIGMWVDARWPSQYSWSLMLLISGMALGCINAWKWLHKEGNID